MKKSPPSLIVIFGSAFLIAFVIFIAIAIDTSKIARTSMNLTLIYDGLAAYAKDHDGLFPDMSSPKALEESLYPRYIPSKIRLLDTYTYKPYIPNPDLSHKSLALLQKRPCSPVLLTSSAGRMYASGHMTQPDE